MRIKAPLSQTLAILLISLVAPTLAAADDSPKTKIPKVLNMPLGPAKKISLPAKLPTLTKVKNDTTSSCTSKNLVLNKKIIQKKGVKNARRALDGRAAKEGSIWNGKASAIFRNAESHLVIDLGQTEEVSAMVFQGDNNDSYAVETSEDGKAFTLYWTVPESRTGGMQMRKTGGIKVNARYLRLSPIGGDKAFSVGEFQAYCKKPAVFPPSIKRIGKAPSKTKKAALSRDQKIAIYKVCMGLFGLLGFVYWLVARRRDFTDDVAMLTSASSIAIMAILAPIFGWLEMGKWSRWFMILSTALSVLSILWFLWILSRRTDLKINHRRFTQGVFGIMVWCSAFSFIEFGTFHGGRAIHYWDSFHYYVGGKYFPENGYDLLYQCAAVSDVEDGRRNEFKDRKIRNLRGHNELWQVFDEDKDGNEFVRYIDDASIAECKSKFTEARWGEFQQDLRLFRTHLGTSRWGKMFMDHGFNATPVWLLFGHTIANIGGGDLLAPAGLENTPQNLRGKTREQRQKISELAKAQKLGLENRIGLLVSIDGLLYFLIFLMIYWAFGLEVCGIAMLIWGTGYPWHYDWTGGSFGRVPWMFMCTAGVCLLKKGHSFFGGFAITWAMLLRLFPGAFIAGITAKIVYGVIQFLRGKQKGFMSPEHWKVTIGCTVSLVGLVLCSLFVVGHFGAYGEFIDNTKKHSATKLTNHMGLPTMVSYDPKHVGKYTKRARLDDPWAVWKKHRSDNLKNRAWLRWGLVLMAFGLLMYIGRRRSDWEVTALSALMAISAAELTCYYFTFVILMAPFALRRGWYAAVLGLMPILSQVIFLSGLWNDVRYVYLSFLVYFALLFVVIGEALAVRKELQAEGKTDKTTANHSEADEVESAAPSSA